MSLLKESTRLQGASFEPRSVGRVIEHHLDFGYIWSSEEYPCWPAVIVRWDVACFIVYVLHCLRQTGVLICVCFDSQATFMTPSGYMAVAKLKDPTALVCMLELGREDAPLAFDYDAMDCLPPKSDTALPIPAEANSEDNSILVFVLVPILAFLLLLALVLIYRNRSLSHHLTDLRSRSLNLDPGAPDIDLDSPLTKVTKYLGKIAETRPSLLRWLFPKHDLAEQVIAVLLDRPFVESMISRC